MDRRTEEQIQKDWDNFLANNREVNAYVTVRIPFSIYVRKDASADVTNELVTKHATSILGHRPHEILSIETP